MPDIRLAVGSSTGRRSTVWTFFTQADEAYILTRMFGSEAKVSLHSSGQCQWSATGDWVRAVPGRRNAERHFKRWEVQRPDGVAALHAFQVRIPSSELRAVPSGEDLAGIVWLPEPASHETVRIECFITPLVDSQPNPESSPDRQHIFSLPLSSGRWFVGFAGVEVISPASLDQLRRVGWDKVMAAGVGHDPRLRAAMFVEYEGTPVRGLIEVCPGAV
jgi:hypothetical protein